jgi:hypothetical protein
MYLTTRFTADLTYYDVYRIYVQSTWDVSIPRTPFSVPYRVESSHTVAQLGIKTKRQRLCTLLASATMIK